MSYLVLARKSRPQRFAEVVGQRSVVRTLQNALAQNRVAHALIFSGVRGTGKTTLARIMAKALNCEQGPAPEPCNTCRSCREIMSGSSVDLQEVDGASNRGIQEIRELKENIRFMPTSSRFKIIIIDEVHMLTTEAFNALLKTLEEPPEHVYFMFATTELHKVPVTILSRCQRYELQRVSHGELATHFNRLADQEGVRIEPQAMRLIVRESGGSVRDGLSLLDQVFSYCGDEVQAKDVVEILGLVSHEVIGELGQALLAGELATALERLDQVYTYGMDVKRFINDLLDWFRALLICRVSREPERQLDLPAEDLEELRQCAARHSAETVSSMFDLLLESLEKVTFATRPRLALEMAFIRAVQAAEVVSVATLLERLDQALQGVELEPVAREPRPERPAATPPVSQVSTQSGTDTETTPSAPPSAPAVRQKPTSPPPAHGKKVPVQGQPDKMAQSRPVSAEDPVPDDTGVVPESGCRGRRKDVRRHWESFIGYVRERKQWMAAVLQRADGARFEEDRLIIQYTDSVDCTMLKNRENITLLTEFAMDFFQDTFRVVFHVPEGDCEVDGENGISPQQERQALANDPLVLAAVEIFNGQVGDIRVGPRFRKPLDSGARDGGDA